MREKAKRGYTKQQKIKILKKAKEILGPKGENWIKGTWYGKRIGKGTHAYLRDRKNPDSFCLLGALEEAALQLGITDQRPASGQIAVDVGLPSFRRTSWNDDFERKFEDITELLDSRLRALRPKKRTTATTKVPPRN